MRSRESSRRASTRRVTRSNDDSFARAVKGDPLYAGHCAGKHDAAIVVAHHGRGVAAESYSRRTALCIWKVPA
jgi:hypothetical protein